MIVSCSPSQSITDIDLLMSFTLTSIVCCNDNGTITTTHTIQSCSSRTFQDIDTGNIIHVDSGSLCDNAIYYINRT